MVHRLRLWRDRQSEHPPTYDGVAMWAACLLITLMGVIAYDVTRPLARTTHSPDITVAASNGSLVVAEGSEEAAEPAAVGSAAPSDSPIQTMSTAQVTTASPQTGGSGSGSPAPAAETPGPSAPIQTPAPQPGTTLPPAESSPVNECDTPGALLHEVTASLGALLPTDPYKNC